LAAPAYVQKLTGCSEDEYWSDPFDWGLEAERVLGSDGIIGVFTPITRGTFKCVDGQVIEKRASYSVESVLAEIDAMPEPEDLEAAFDEDLAYADFKKEFESRQSQCREILWCPADWKLIPKALWYHEFGYESALMTLALHPDRYRKLIRVSATEGRQKAVVRARAIREGISPRAILTGEDLCSQEGPMVSPAYLRREYYPLLEYALEPLIEAGAKIIWHCDGSCLPILPDVLACGIAGLQGFQRECGMKLEELVELRTREGRPLIIFGPLSVTTTLPYGTEDDVRKEVYKAMDTCRDAASLVFFSSNTLNPDIPLDNILTFWRAVQDASW